MAWFMLSSKVDMTFWDNLISELYIPSIFSEDAFTEDEDEDEDEDDDAEIDAETDESDDPER